MSSMFDEAQLGVLSAEVVLNMYENGDITRKHFIEDMHQHLQPIKTLVDNKYNFKEVPDDEKV